MPDAPTPQPDSKHLFDLLLGLKMEPGDAYTFTQEVGNMAAANLIARFESKLEAQNAQTASLKSEIASLRWMIGLGFTLLALLITLLRFLG